MGKQAKDKDAVSLVDVLRTATAADLQEITDAVTTLETDLAALVADKSREIDALKAAAKMLSIRINGKPPRQPRGAKAAKAAKETGATGRESEEDGDKLKCRIFDLIAEDGPQTIVELATALDRTKQAVAMCVSTCDWFVRTGDEVSNA